MLNISNDHDWLSQIEDDTESDYSLDYEYIGPRQPIYRSDQDADSVCSELSDSPCHNGFDMWDEDPYSTNDFTWESNDMKLTSFIKSRKKELDAITTPWKKSSFYTKERGWPRQLPYSSSTTNHDQSASSLCLTLSDYGTTEKLHAIYRDRIIECGTPLGYPSSHHSTKQSDSVNTTWLESQEDNHSSSSSSSSSSSHCKSPSSITQASSSSSSIFYETHASVSLPPQEDTLAQQNTNHSYPVDKNNDNNNNNSTSLLSKFVPYTKYIKRSQFPIAYPKDAYLPLSFEPLCLAEKYGYMAIGGLEGEFEIYCCMEDQPIKIWGTKFKGKNNVMLMTNAIQIVRFKKQKEHKHLLIACMNDAGVLIYELPKHSDCHPLSPSSVTLLHHIRSFDRVPINDARLSPNNEYLICVGDDACIFYLTLAYNNHDQLTVTTPKRILIPDNVLCLSHSPYSSQHLAWSKSSLYFAHTSDTHSFVLVWRTQPKLEMLYRIDAGGYTYAIQFHPEYEGVLAFSNRYGYLHTVDLTEAVSIYNPNQIVSIHHFDRPSTTSPGHVCTPSCTPSDDPIYHTADLVARQEITMVSFRGEKNRRLRILAKINGIQWSHDGKYLYISTKKRVLAYQFVKSMRQVDSLEKMAGLKVLSIMEEQGLKKRKRAETEWEQSKRLAWTHQWNQVPKHVRDKVLAKTTDLASH
ncbi:hypothetical protein G6F70_007049 [Rhizopus microsporus]|uniref:Uncharacterized protein n=1 Tax=Rhizopus azygosporus TaxID=86630 RepID=A0A367IVP6_RHIAZ|nr:hypothetical protein G6F71_006998 [Rhizopus microsporus]RCH81747.1 hypothetical protein CU097_002803 [Rhizopus azygosporus]KAG1196913.1 hypothetical protein G6F70_007049 [Rhizopus microsporus]KAG1211117.1 hypothetical protein G6F69_004860 [Rhizopus microsporus]KAG1230138.1 hypothetical protein G6F67_006660 [Rhizopus microsporus]